MAVGDVKGARRRIRALQRKGHAPVKSGLSVSESISRQKEIAARARKAMKSK